MDTVESVFADGKWVQLVDHRLLTGYSGFILKYDSLDDKYKIKITKGSTGKKASGHVWVDSDQLVLIDILKDEDDLLSMIDLALDLNDKEWFNELTNQLPLRGW